MGAGGVDGEGQKVVKAVSNIGGIACYRDPGTGVYTYPIAARCILIIQTSASVSRPGPTCPRRSGCGVLGRRAQRRTRAADATRDAQPITN
jgi:hypothetical protein